MLLKDGRDTADLDPNELGEMMRKSLFRGSEKGCYTDFDVSPNWQKLIFDEYAFTMVMERPSEGEDDVEVFKNGEHYTHIDRQIDAAWYWEGDGTLTFFVDGRGIINPDCKKQYNWREWDGTGAFKGAVRQVPVLGRGVWGK